MTALNIASKANQAITLPAVLVATYANNSDTKTPITINYEDVDTLKTGDKALVEFLCENESPIHGFEHVIGKLLEAYPSLQGENENYVGQSWQIAAELCRNRFCRSENGSPVQLYFLPRISSLSREHYSNWTLI